MDLNVFRNVLKNGGARPSQFEMRVSWPSGWRPESNTEQEFRFMCSISEIPGSQIGKISVPYFGRKLNYAGDRVFSDLTVTIFNDENFRIRRSFESWMRAITGHETVVSQFDGSITERSYVADSTVIHYSRNLGGSPIAAYRFVGMYPQNLSPINLNWSSTDEIESFTVELTYQWWEPISFSDIR